MRKLIFFILFISEAVPVFSQFVLSGEIRPKFEFRDGYKTLLTDDQKPAYISAQRTRLIFNFKDDRIATRFSVQDVRIWGESPSKSDVSSLNVFEAWAEIYLNKAWSLRLGRQELSFDQNRLLGASNWNDVGASHDVAQLKYHGDFDLKAGFAYNNDKSKNYESNYPVKYYKTLYFLRGEKNLGRYLNGSLIFIGDGNQKENSPDTVYHRFTYGANLLFRNDSVRTKIYGTVYLQNGKTAEGVPISAWFMALNLDYSFSNALNGIIAAEYFSGQDAFDPENKHKAFNNLYGNGHSYYGNMDYFSQIDDDTKNGGLMDLYLRLNYKFSKKTSGEFTYHYLAFTNSVIDSISKPGSELKADPYLGSEIDLSIKYKPAENTEFSCGYSTMLSSQSMEILKGGDHSKYQQWAWIMLTFKPEFLNTGKNK